MQQNNLQKEEVFQKFESVTREIASLRQNNIANVSSIALKTDNFTTTIAEIRRKLDQLIDLNTEESVPDHQWEFIDAVTAQRKEIVGKLTEIKRHTDRITNDSNRLDAAKDLILGETTRIDTILVETEDALVKIETLMRDVKEVDGKTEFTRENFLNEHRRN